MDAATLWRTRVTWALVGAGVTLVIASVREQGEAEAGLRAEEPPLGSHEPAAPLASTTAVVAARPLAGVDPRVDPTPPAATPGETAASPTAAPPSTTSAPVAASPTAAPPSTTSAPAVAFEIPLPQMPGTRVMKRSQRPDAELGGTIVTLSVSVPAPGAQVEAFYRAALVDAKLVVTGGSREPSTMGTGHRGSLRGRGRDANVHVNIQHRAGTLRTIVRIIWRTLP